MDIKQKRQILRRAALGLIIALQAVIDAPETSEAERRHLIRLIGNVRILERAPL